MIKKSKRQSKYFAPQNTKGETHTCDYPGCSKAGEYRAPKNTKLKEYYWFCLEHVQEYNAKWNYYENDFEPEENEDDARRQFKFSSHIKYNFGFDFNGGYDFFRQKDLYSPSSGIRLNADERQALKIMEIDYDDLTVDSLKKAYKKAVKKYHPDINSSNKESEEIFKVLSTSYKSMINKLSRKP